MRFINPDTLSKAPGYSHVVEVRDGRTIYISGQIALDEAGRLVGPGDFRAQTERVFENLRLALDSAGASFHDVVKLTIFVTDASQLAVLREIRDRYVNTASPPASTLMQVKGLAREDLLVEIEAVAFRAE